jgi:hypothetical protein
MIVVVLYIGGLLGSHCDATAVDQLFPGAINSTVASFALFLYWCCCDHEAGREASECTACLFAAVLLRARSVHLGLQQKHEKNKLLFVRLASCAAVNCNWIRSVVDSSLHVSQSDLSLGVVLVANRNPPQRQS